MGDGDFRDQRPHEPGSMSAPGFVFLRRRPRVFVRHYKPQTHLHWTPRVDLHALESIWTRQREVVERIVQRPAEVEIRRREEMVLRMAMQGTRIENGSPARGAGPIETQPGPSFPAPVPSPRQMLVRQAPRTIERTRSDQPHSQMSSSPSATTPAQPLDLNRLTEQVIRTIDRRLQAYRERTGRR